MHQTISIPVGVLTNELKSAPHDSVHDKAGASIQNNAMPSTVQPETGSVICFGPFRLFTSQRLLLEGAVAVRLGSRAFDILVALIRRPGQLVANWELRELVWPNTFVVEANLTVNVAALRRALSDGKQGNRYIINVPGRGYYFVAPVSFEETTAPTLQH